MPARGTARCSGQHPVPSRGLSYAVKLFAGQDIDLNSNHDVASNSGLRPGLFPCPALRPSRLHVCKRSKALAREAWRRVPIQALGLRALRRARAPERWSQSSGSCPRGLASRSVSQNGSDGNPESRKHITALANASQDTTYTSQISMRFGRREGPNISRKRLSRSISGAMSIFVASCEEYPRSRLSTTCPQSNVTQTRSLRAPA